MGLPAPRRVRGKPFFQIASASAWTTLQLIIYADGTAKHKLIGRARSRVTGSMTTRASWSRRAARSTLSAGGASRSGRTCRGAGRLAGGDQRGGDGLERELSRIVMAKAKPLERRQLEEGETLVEQDESGKGSSSCSTECSTWRSTARSSRRSARAILGVHASVTGGAELDAARATRCRVVVIPENMLEQAEIVAIASQQRRELN